MGCVGDQNVLRSNLRFTKPPSSSNLALELVKALKKNKDRVLLIDGQARSQGPIVEYSGSLLWLEISRIASGLIQSELKLGNGEPIMFMCEPSMRQMLVLLGSLCAGATIMASSAMASDAQLKSFAEQAEPKVIFVDADNYHAAKQLRSEAPGLLNTKIVILDRLLHEKIASEIDGINIFSAEKTLFGWSQVDEKLIMRRVKSKINGKKQPAYLIMNPAKAVRPEIVPWTHKMFLNDIWKFGSATKSIPTRKSVTKKIANRMKTKQEQAGTNPVVDVAENDATINDDSKLPLIPIDPRSSVLSGDFRRCYLHVTTSLYWSLFNGCKFVVMDSIKEHHVWREVARFKITAFIANATFTYRLLDKLIVWIDRPPRSGRPDVSSMRYMACTASKLNIGEILQTLQPIYPNLRVAQFYGTPEAGYVTIQTVEDSCRRFEPSGHLLPGVKAKIGEPVSSKTSKELASPNKDDELLIKTKSLFKGYLPLGAEEQNTNKSNKLKLSKSGKINKKGYYNTGELAHHDDVKRIHFIAPFSSKHRNSTLRSSRTVTPSPIDRFYRIEEEDASLGSEKYTLERQDCRLGSQRYTIDETREERTLP